ncbi:hypothetical protein [Streptomyces acidiscabies]|uniref:hypothetical protein n=1 Tax=Streptomyces acidiscabies TaxID=42234 RepID=UPI00211728C0|nr:hypothetical protein [Streptomyces acidiscabies]
MPVEELLAFEAGEVAADAGSGGVEGAADDVVRLECLDGVQEGGREVRPLAGGAGFAGVEAAS